MFQVYFKKFLYFQTNFDLEMSKKIFGNRIGHHLFDKWLFYERNIIDFINYLDDENKQKIFDYLTTQNN
jgi:hypothetical protein